MTYQAIPLALTMIALLLTGFGSWSCKYFTGANIGFTGKYYGLWTIEDITGQCQLWDVLFFSYHLDGALVTARVMSMAAMMLGLAMLATMSQAMQYHIVSWGIGVVFFVVFITSLSTTSNFNVWVVFWWFTYVILVLIVRALFIHPVHRRISPRGSKYIAICMIMCMIFNVLTLVVLSSDYCTCDSLTAGELEGRVIGDPCDRQCHLSSAGYLMIAGAAFWLFAAIATQKIGVQPEVLHDNPTTTGSMYGGFVTKSITTRTKDFARKLTRSRDEGDQQEGEHQEGEDGRATRPRRTRCQRLCCDFRVKERSRLEKWLYWLFRIALFILMLIYLFILVISIGSRTENLNAERAPDTSPNFILDPVCAFDPLDTTAQFDTFPTADEAREANMTIAHCGPCALCSNMPDIKTYIVTRKTIADTVKTCGPISLLGTYDALVKCLEDRVHLSHDCTICWANNMKSTGRQCLFTCMKTLFTGFMNDNNVPGAGQQGWLNHCLQCDEKLSGNGFVTCSGVARRRLNISSEIERHPEQQCSTVGLDWLTYFDNEE
jgi:hypothetical protein